MHFDLLSALIGLVAGKAKPEYFSNTVKSMKETESISRIFGTLIKISE